MTLPVNSPFIPVAEGSSSTLVRSANLPSYIVSNTSVLGQAFAVDMQTGADIFGALLRVPRLSGEDDIVYLGRLQRLLIVARQRNVSGSVGFIVRSLSAYLGRVSITQPWDGISGSSLPADTSFLDLLDPLPAVATKSADITFDATGLIGSTYVDLTGLHVLQSNSRTLWQGRDYLVQGDSSFVLTSAFPGPYSLVSVPNKARVVFGTGRADKASFTSETLPSRSQRFAEAPPETIRISNSINTFPFTARALTAGTSTTPVGPFLRGRSVSALGTDRIEHRLLMQPGASLKTALGHSLLDSPTLKWSSAIASGHLVPLDI